MARLPMVSAYVSALRLSYATATNQMLDQGSDKAHHGRMRPKLRQLFYGIIICTIVLALLGSLHILEDRNLTDRTQERLYKSGIIHFSDIKWRQRTRSHLKNKTKSVSFFSGECRRPRLDLHNDANKNAYKSLPPLRCEGASLFYVSSQTLLVNRSVLGDRQLQSCEFSGIERFSDDGYTMTEIVTLTEEPFALRIFHDFVHIGCFLNKESDSQNLLQSQKLTTQENSFHTEPNNQNSKQDKYSKHSKTASNGFLSFDEQRTNSSNVSLGTNVSVGTSIVNSFEKLSYEQTTLPDRLDPVDEYEYYQYGTGSDYEIFPDFEQFLVQISPTKRGLKQIHKFQRREKSLNVLVFAIDSMSHLSYQRKLPKTYHFLKHVLEAAIMDGYNIVGDAAIAAMLPLLTGKTLLELPEARIGDFPDSSYVDRYPLVWKKFRKRGYVTMLAEDEPNLGMFNLRLKGFNAIPTDHYMRPFWQAVWGSMLRERSEGLCTGDTPHHKYLLDYTRDFFIKYRNVSKFSLTFSTELTHDTNDPAEYCDEDLVDFLKFLKEHQFLDNTVLITMADHGSRYNKVRRTVQGKLEERLPFMSLVFPKWFHEEYPHLIRNLYNNIAKITTPFDIHETLLDILNISRTEEPLDVWSRGMSLLRNIPINRTCESAQIPVHWCACLEKEDVDTHSPHVRAAALHTIHHINNMTLPLRKFCARLKLKEILTANRVVPNDKVLKFKTTKEEVPQFYNDSTIDVSVFQVTIETAPNDGMYEVTVQVYYTNSTYTVTDISRISRYGDQPKCVKDKYPELMPYCYCLNTDSDR
ncbi:hypothetical protein ScPMuIL_018553 [Solemya velum]